MLAAMPRSLEEMPQSTEAVQPNSSSKEQTLLKRTFSTVSLWALVIGAFWFDNQWLYLTLYLAAAICALLEYFKLVPDKGFRRFRWHAIAVTLGFSALLFSGLWNWNPKWAQSADGLALATLIALIAADRLRSGLDGYRSIDEIAMTVFGFVYVVILFAFLPKILLLPLEDLAGNPAARFYAVYLLVVTKFTDTGAYLVGSTIGKHKMIPRISPGKTWQGFGGAVLFSLLGSFGCYFIFGKSIPLITPLHAGILGIVLALVAVLGDLVESILKRSLEAKDSGNVMPGIGGVLDLIDSILLTGPVFFFYLILLLG